jgi:hypothetical protein
MGETSLGAVSVVSGAGVHGRRITGSHNMFHIILFLDSAIAAYPLVPSAIRFNLGCEAWSCWLRTAREGSF